MEVKEIPVDKVERDREWDKDVAWVLWRMDEKPPAKVLEVGAWSENLGLQLALKGFDVTGVDLHPYDGPPHANYRHIVGDFCRLDLEEYDIVVSTSAIEHFGLGTYDRHQEVIRDVHDLDYDQVAMRKVFEVLRPGGVCYVTVPFGKSFRSNSDWRVYNPDTIGRIIQRFEVETTDYFLSAALPERKWNLGKKLTKEEVLTVDGIPNSTVGLKLRRAEAVKYHIRFTDCA